jgi:hypothetical protein
MTSENEKNVSEKNSEKYEGVVNIPIALYESVKGRYFIGQTEAMWVSNTSNAWAGLFNPADSKTELYANVITISNFSNENIVAEIWFNTNFNEEGKVSKKVSPSNTALQPKPNNKIEIRYVQSTEDTPQGGINVFDRIVTPNGTLVSEDDGKLIFPPNGNYTVFIKSSSPNPSKVIVACGWWEKKL